MISDLNINDSLFLRLISGERVVVETANDNGATLQMVDVEKLRDWLNEILVDGDCES